MTEDISKPGRQWTRILLAVSLGINLLIAGIFVGAHFSGSSGHRSADRDRVNLPIGPYGRAFSKEDRAELRKAFEARGPWFRKSRQQMRGFGEELAAAMRAEPFNPSDVTDILARQSAVQASFQTEGQKLLVERVTAMTPDQRAAFADNLENGLKRGKRRR